ncbi:hypothetical protein EDB82DRAFT_454149 [Fusarium venenatum]|uniref:uncharacterized protein n=1 Tax=Fusarium venenatum TaxID=56646 RepID=UPI001D82EE53|nr:hypothetical protein EDB82DRAFT_454149 [Fusarium venenatum]
MRKSHKKSRLGCQTCKKRKVKCDEAKPQCGRCIQFGVPCDFSPAPPGSQVLPISQSEPQPRRRGRPRSDWTSWTEQIRSHATMTAEESSNPLCTTDMELFHNYMTKTAATLSDGGQNRLWYDGVPQVGLQHPCILNLVLSLSSYHLAKLKPVDKPRYLLLAEKHLTASLQPATVLIGRLDVESAPAAYLTSVLICFVALAKGPSSGNFLLVNQQDQVSWLHLLRGVRLVVESTGWSSVFSGMLAEYAPTPSSSPPGDITPVDPALMVNGIEDWRSSLNNISNLITRPADERLTKAYEHELKVLTDCFEGIFGQGQNASLNAVGKLEIIISWIYQLKDDYMEGLHQGDTVAIVILGHFCVLLRTSEEKYWFMQEWAVHIMKGILAMSEDFRIWLSWPLAYLNLDCQR